MLPSCHALKRGIEGTYYLKNYPKTQFQFNPDSSFAFFNFHPNPYLLPYEHPEDYFFKTTGRWKMGNGKYIVVTSEKDSIIDRVFKIQEIEPKKEDRSNFTFFDSYGDTIPILYAQYPDSTIVSSFNDAMPDYLEDFKEHEYVEFYFYGYKPFKAMKDQNGFKDFNIVLYPMYKPSYFDGSLFNYGRNKIIDNEQKAIFKRNSNGSYTQYSQ